MTALQMQFSTTIRTEGHRRWLVVSWEGTKNGLVEVKERWPLQMDKLSDENRAWHMEQIGRRLHAKIKKLVGVRDE